MKLNDITYKVIALDTEMFPSYRKKYLFSVKTINFETIINNMTFLNRHKFSELYFAICLHGNFNRV